MLAFDPYRRSMIFSDEDIAALQDALIPSRKNLFQRFQNELISPTHVFSKLFPLDNATARASQQTPRHLQIFGN